MNATNTLTYDDLSWRVSQIAQKHNAWSDDSAISLPAIAPSPTSQSAHDRGLLTFLYRIQVDKDASNPNVLHPHAAAVLRPDGDLMSWEKLSAASSSPLGSRYDGGTRSMLPVERTTFIKLYYILLVAEDGPLHANLAGVTPSVKNDLSKLFFGLVEAPFLPLYHRYATDFVALLDVS